jgi:hypothetical protein
MVIGAYDTHETSKKRVKILFEKSGGGEKEEILWENLDVNGIIILKWKKWDVGRRTVSGYDTVERFCK